MASRLNISVKTVSSHRSQIMRKLNILIMLLSLQFMLLEKELLVLNKSVDTK
ncbi:MAG: response regulator transcription factor [bacterium]|nr:response regulator transcription factor [bacterium]